MTARSIASLSISFGLVSMPVKLYSATETSSAIQFKLLGRDGSRVRQQYVSDGPAPSTQGFQPDEPAQPPQGTTFRPQLVSKDADSLELAVEPPRTSKATPERAFQPPDAAPAVPSATGPQVVERSTMVKGYEFERGKFVTFTADELKALQEGARETIDIVSFIPERSVDPIYFDKAYYLAPDKRGGKPYSLLLEAMKTTGRCALAKWAFRSKEYVVQIRPTDGGMVLQQLLYDEEVRSIADLDIDLVIIGQAELKLAQQLIQQISADGYEPGLFVDEEKKRILAAVEGKIAGQQVLAPTQASEPSGGQVIDLMTALRASLGKQSPVPLVPVYQEAATPDVEERKPVRRVRASATSAKPRKKTAS